MRTEGKGGKEEERKERGRRAGGVNMKITVNEMSSIYLIFLNYY